MKRLNTWNLDSNMSITLGIHSGTSFLRLCARGSSKHETCVMAYYVNICGLPTGFLSKSAAGQLQVSWSNGRCDWCCHSGGWLSCPCQRCTRRWWGRKRSTRCSGSAEKWNGHLYCLWWCRWASSMLQNMQRNFEVDSQATSKPFGCDRVEEKHWD